jgi:hypothetical protein
MDRDDAKEDRLAGRPWGSLKRGETPPCMAESGGFMSDNEWIRSFDCQRRLKNCQLRRREVAVLLVD